MQSIFCDINIFVTYSLEGGSDMLEKKPRVDRVV
jgi:hypothetical protein